MPPEIKREIVYALLDLEPSAVAALSPEAEARALAGWGSDWCNAKWQYGWHDQFRFQHKRRWERLGDLALVNREFELIAAEWTWKFHFYKRRYNSPESEVSLEPRLGAYVRFISFLGVDDGLYNIADFAALIPTLPLLDGVAMTTPNSIDHRPEYTLVLVVAVAQIGRQIKSLHLKASRWDPYPYSMALFPSPGDAREAQSSAWLSRYLTAFPNLTSLEVASTEGSRADGERLAATITHLPKLAILRLSGYSDLPSPAAIPPTRTATIQALHAEHLIHILSFHNDLQMMESWLSSSVGLGSTLETLVWTHPIHFDPQFQFAPERDNFKIFDLPRLTSLSLHVTDLQHLLPAFVNAPIKNFVFDVDMYLQAQDVVDFISAHSTLEKVWCRDGCGDRDHFSVKAVKASCKARRIAFRKGPACR